MVVSPLARAISGSNLLCSHSSSFFAVAELGTNLDIARIVPFVWFITFLGDFTSDRLKILTEHNIPNDSLDSKLSLMSKCPVGILPLVKVKTKKPSKNLYKRARYVNWEKQWA